MLRRLGGVLCSPCVPDIHRLVRIPGQCRCTLSFSTSSHASMSLIAYQHQGSDTKARCTLDTFVACVSYNKNKLCRLWVLSPRIKGLELHFVLVDQKSENMPTLLFSSRRECGYVDPEITVLHKCNFPAKSEIGSLCFFCRTTFIDGRALVRNKRLLMGIALLLPEARTRSGTLHLAGSVRICEE